MRVPDAVDATRTEEVDVLAAIEVDDDRPGCGADGQTGPQQGLLQPGADRRELRIPVVGGPRPVGVARRRRHDALSMQAATRSDVLDDLRSRLDRGRPRSDIVRL